MNRENVLALKKEYPAGTRVMLLADMKDDYNKYNNKGLCGTVKGVDDIGTIHTQWDNGSSLGLILEEDKFEIIKEGSE